MGKSKSDVEKKLDEICKRGAKTEHILEGIKDYSSRNDIPEKCPNCGGELYVRRGHSYSKGYLMVRDKVKICINCDEAWVWTEET